MYRDWLRDTKITYIARLALIAAVIIGMALFAWTNLIVYAGKEGVLISNSVYFTLEDVAISKGLDTQIMSFNIQLNNDSDSVVDYNHYGIKVASQAGGSYYARMTKTTDGLVAVHSTTSYNYVTTIPIAVETSQLQVTVFERSGGKLLDVGSLSVASAQSFGEQPGQLLLNLADVDTSLTTSSYVTVQVLKAITVPQDGKWTLLVDALLTPTGSESITLPTGLKYLLHDEQDKILVFTANAINGNSINAGQTKHVLLTVELDTIPNVDKMVLELANNNLGTISFGKLSLISLSQVAKMGEKIPYLIQGREGLNLELQKAEEQLISNKKGVLITTVLHNGSKSALQTPTLTGTMISDQAALSIATDTIISPDAYIAQGKSGIYKFFVLLPEGIAAEQLKFVTGTSNTASGKTTGAAVTSATKDNSLSVSTANITSTVPIALVSLQDGITTATNLDSIASYTLGQAFTFDSGSKLIDPELEMSVVELNGYTNADNGYQSVIAKFKFLNKSNETLALPTFDTTLTDASGTSFPGTRETTSLTQLIPNAAYVYSYSYMLPPTATGAFKLSILDTSNFTQVKLPIADYKVTMNQTGEDDPNAISKVLSFYPYTVNIENWELSSVYSSNAYSYKLKLSLDIQKVAEVIVDNTIATMEFELVDGRDRILGSNNQTLQGKGKLINGAQTVTFTDIKSEQLDYPLTLRIYENITTSAGVAKRLMATFKQ
ncbi:hypothetical protein OB236_02670 [Paenibacillus sp. WQ 127069]|uniref:DUF4179 domain-containing protein n=1 Tax=Paenibacillus baimaensis TaxID=2982185 RepID=A0ABT2U8R8_9BACL|nr:hypothetical protein [Paenibacillus sp. WQ 127069]MCU6791024.1 hypothetical protein [Paenibacillus sp. WQ 127069]